MDVVAFDLDDTLYKEVEFVESAFRAVGMEYSLRGADGGAVAAAMLRAFENGRNPIDAAMALYPGVMPEADAVAVYRFHKPDIVLSKQAGDVLDRLAGKGYLLALITDGRSATQRNKIQALGLEKYFLPGRIFISEETGCDKTGPKSFELLQESCPSGSRFCYVGDNPAKDFLFPNKFGWVTVCLADNGQNIHHQNLELADGDYCPQYSVRSLSDIVPLLERLWA